MTRYIDSDGLDRSTGDAIAAGIVAKLYGSEHDEHEACRAENERLRDALALIIHHQQPSSSEMRRIARDALGEPKDG